MEQISGRYLALRESAMELFIEQKVDHENRPHFSSAAYKNRTREEIIAAFRESIRKKHEWQERAEEEIKKIRQERLQLSI